MLEISTSNFDQALMHTEITYSVESIIQNKLNGISLIEIDAFQFQTSFE
jgi:hypothetical protein